MNLYPFDSPLKTNAAIAPLKNTYVVEKTTETSYSFPKTAIEYTATNRNVKIKTMTLFSMPIFDIVC